MKSMLTLAIAWALCTPACADILFVEDFDDSSAFNRWSPPVVDAELGVFDGLLNYDYDYSLLGIPSAPSSAGTTVGARVEANFTQNGPIDEGVAVATIADGLNIPTGDFSVSAEVYYFVAPGFEDVATQYITLGAFTSGPKSPLDSSVNDEVPFRFGLSNGDGLAWQVTGDGGSSTDIIRYEDPGNADAGSQTNIGSLDDIPFGDIPGVTTGAGNPMNPFEQFGLQNRWVTLSLVGEGDSIGFLINGVEVDSVDNSDGRFDGGSIMFGLTDAFNSSTNAEGAVALVVDNISVEGVPEPTAALMAVLAIGGMVSRRRI